MIKSSFHRCTVAAHLHGIRPGMQQVRLRLSESVVGRDPISTMLVDGGREANEAWDQKRYPVVVSRKKKEKK